MLEEQTASKYLPWSQSQGERQDRHNSATAKAGGLDNRMEEKTQQKMETLHLSQYGL